MDRRPCRLLRVGLAALVASVALVNADCANLSDLTEGDGGGDGGGGRDGGGGDDQTSVADGGTDTDGAQTTPDDGQVPPLPDGAPLPPGFIFCAASNVPCNLHENECCEMIYGTNADAAVFDNAVATCEAAGSPNCNFSTSVGGSFVVAFPQLCATKSDCDAGEICCALSPSSGTNADMLSGVDCETAAACTNGGRILCATVADCPTPLDCVPETDPILSHVFPTRCR